MTPPGVRVRYRSRVARLIGEPDMVLLMTVAAVVSVTQLALIGAWARSLRVTTLLLGVLAGFLVCGPAAVALQWAWTRAVAGIGPWSLRDVVDTAGWTVDPLLEEVVKVAPLALLAWRWVHSHRQLGYVDHLLAGGALGMGFELFEATLRFGRLGMLAMPTTGGYVVTGNLAGVVTVPSIWTSLTTWQPAPASFAPLFSVGEPEAIQHLVWTALAGAGVAWFTRRRDMWRWAGALPLVVATLDHANYNADATGVAVAATSTSAVIAWVGYRLSGLLVVGILAGTAADRTVLARARRDRRDVLLPGEPAHGLDPRAVAHAGLLAPPWSTAVTWRLVLARRAALTASALPGSTLVDRVRDDVTLLAQATDVGRWRSAGRRLMDRPDLGVLRSWRSVVWLVCAFPPLAYLVVGGFPATRALQRSMAGPVGTWSLVLAVAAGGVLVATQVPGWVRQLRSVKEPALHEERLRVGTRCAAGTASLVTGVLLLAATALSGDPTRGVVRNFHALDALSSAQFVLGLAIIAASFLFFPPAAAFAVTTAGTLVLTGSGVALAAGTVVGSHLVLQALLSEASGSSGRGARPDRGNRDEGSNRAPDDDFRGSGYSRDEIEQFVNGHTGDGNPAMGRPTQGQVHDALTRGTPERLAGQNAEKFEWKGIRVIVNYDLPWKSTAYRIGGAS